MYFYNMPPPITYSGSNRHLTFPRPSSDFPGWFAKFLNTSAQILGL